MCPNPNIHKSGVQFQLLSALTVHSINLLDYEYSSVLRLLSSLRTVRQGFRPFYRLLPVKSVEKNALLSAGHGGDRQKPHALPVFAIKDCSSGTSQRKSGYSLLGAAVGLQLLPHKIRPGSLAGLPVQAFAQHALQMRRLHGEKQFVYRIDIQSSNALHRHAQPQM